MDTTGALHGQGGLFAQMDLDVYLDEKECTQLDWCSHGWSWAFTWTKGGIYADKRWCPCEQGLECIHVDMGGIYANKGGVHADKFLPHG
jgi:hypothetical protein